MKTFGELKGIDRKLAVARAEFHLVSAIVEGVLEFKMPNKLHDFDFKSILSNARKQDFGIVEIKRQLMAHDEIGAELKKLSMVIAEGSRWDENIQPIMEGA